MPASVTFSSLRAFLEGLGFSPELEERRVTFRHPDSSAVIILRPLSDADLVSATDLVLVRRVLDDFGLMEGAATDQALRGLVRAG